MGEVIYETKLFLDFDDLWNNYSDDKCILLCVSQRDISVLLAGIRYAEYRSRWLSSTGDLLRDQGRLADLETALQYITDLEHTLMADCGTQFAEGLISLGESIKAGLLAIANKPCCPTSVNVNIVQGVTPGGNVSYGTQTGATEGNPSTDPPPEGFETWEQFYTYKCQAAHWVADSLIAVYRNLGVMQLSAIAVGSVAVGAALGGLVTFVPPAAIVLLIGGLIGLGISLTVVNSIGDWLSDHRTDVICALYGSASTGDAIDGFWGLVSEALEELTIAEGLTGWIKQVTLALLTTDLLNTLFNNSLQTNYPDADCSNCDDAQCEDTLYNFADSETNGAELIETRCDEIPTTPTQTMTPDAAGLILAATAASGSRFAAAEFDANILIGASSQLRMYYSNQLSLTTSIGVFLVTNLDCRYFADLHGAGTFTETYSLAAFEGEIIDKIQILVNTDAGNPQVLIREIEFICTP